MKIDSTTYKQAHSAATRPRMSFLMMGLICGAVVPTVYLRSYYLPHLKDARPRDDTVNFSQEQSDLPEHNIKTNKMGLLANLKKNSIAAMDGSKQPFVENPTKSSEGLNALSGVRDIPIAAHHINGRNRYSNDENYRRLVEEANAVMLSSII